MRVVRRRFARLRWRLSMWLADLGVRHPIVRYMLAHWLIGIGTGLFCAAMLLALNPAGFRDLLFRSEAMIPALVLLFGGFAVTFGGVVCAAAVMYPNEDEMRGSKAPTTPPEAALAVARARSGG